MSLKTSSMKFVREIPIEKIVDKLVNDLEQDGFTLIWREDSLEIWVEMGVN